GNGHGRIGDILPGTGIAGVPVTGGAHLDGAVVEAKTKGFEVSGALAAILVDVVAVEDTAAVDFDATHLVNDRADTFVIIQNVHSTIVVLVSEVAILRVIIANIPGLEPVHIARAL